MQRENRQKARLGSVLRDPMTHAVVALGLTQIIAWGTSLYALAVLGKPIAADTGWSQATIFGGLTLGLLVSSAISTWVGRLIDRRGARLVMSTGSILLAACLAALAFVRSEYEYFAVWFVTGIAMRLTLYDAAFAALVQVTPTRGRRAISYLTLFGGFASTVFWPIGHALNASYGWRTTFLIFAAINLLVCLPLHVIGLARRDPPVADDEANTTTTGVKPGAAPLEGRAKLIAMVLFGIVVAGNAFVFGALAAHLVALIEQSGVSLTVAVWLASLKGVAQVAGRVGDIVFGRNAHPLTIGRIAIGLLPISFLVLAFAPSGFNTALAFTLMLGVSNGIVTIVRGAVPLALFGPKGYGEILGILATPYWLLNAMAPAVFALLIDRWGYRMGELVLFGFAIVSLIAMEIIAAWYRGHVRRAEAEAEGGKS